MVVQMIDLGRRDAPEQCELIHATHRPAKANNDALDTAVVRFENLKIAAKFAPTTDALAWASA
jgi:hypothetical protein